MIIYRLIIIFLLYNDTVYVIERLQIASINLFMSLVNYFLCFRAICSTNTSKDKTSFALLQRIKLFENEL